MSCKAPFSSITNVDMNSVNDILDETIYYGNPENAPKIWKETEKYAFFLMFLTIRVI
jgi:hypothetical protein